MKVGRALAWLLLVLAAASVGFEAYRWAVDGVYRVVALGEIWYSLDPASLNGAQAVVQRYLLPVLWDPVIVWILTLPGWAVFGVPGLALRWLCRVRRRRHFV